MIHITQDEAFMLRSKNRGHDVHMSKSRHPKYYATESYKTLKILEKYRKSKVIKTYE